MGSAKLHKSEAEWVWLGGVGRGAFCIRIVLGRVLGGVFFFLLCLSLFCTMFWHPLELVSIFRASRSMLRQVCLLAVLGFWKGVQKALQKQTQKWCSKVTPGLPNWTPKATRNRRNSVRNGGMENACQNLWKKRGFLMCWTLLGRVLAQAGALFSRFCLSVKTLWN